MSTAMQEIEPIHERDDLGEPGRRLAMLAMAALSTIGLVVAMGILLGRSTAAASVEEPDPLAALDGAFAGAGATPEALEEPLAVERDEMTFHETLVGEERLDVATAMAAAAADIDRPRRPAEDEPSGPSLAEDPRVDPAAHGPGGPVPVSAMSAASPLPATEIAPAGNLALTPIASAAMEPRAPRAEEGADGKYTLHVMSYRTREESEVFTEVLRARGHAAFVLVAEIPERGTYYRVRIGPFDSMREAERYRAEFERQERMNTSLIRRRD